MRIHRIVLRNFRGVVESTVTFPEVGVTIIEGDNEVGKSCIAESIDLVLHKPDSSASQQVKAVRPVHRDEGPEVEIEMSTGPYRFVLRKRWHRHRETVLEIIEPQRANLTGREAHERVQSMLDETLDHQLFSALRLEQGVDLQIPGFDVPSLGRALDLVVGGEQAGDREDDLWQRISAERERYWTPTGLKKGERDQLARRLEMAKSEVAVVESQLRDVEAAVDEVVALVERARVVRDAEADHARHETTLVQRWEAIERRQSLLRQMVSDHEVAVSRFDRVADESSRRVELVHEAEASAERLRSLDESARVRPELDAVLQRNAEVRAAVDVAKRAFLDGERCYRLACDDRDQRRGEMEIAQLTERRDRVLEAHVRLAAAEAVLDETRITDEMLADIEAAHLALLHADARAEQGSARVEITSLDGSTIEVDADQLTLASGASALRQVTDAIEVTVPGVVRVHMRAGTDARAAAEHAAAALTRFTDLLRDARVDDLAGARFAVARRNDAERIRGEVATTTRQDLRDLTLDMLSTKIERLGARLRAYAAERQVDPPMPEDLDAAQLTVTQTATMLDERRVTLHRCEDDGAACAGELQRAQIEGVSLESRIGQLEASSAHVADVLDTARRDRTDAQIATDLAAAEVTLTASAEARDLVQSELAGDDPETVADLLQNSREARRRAADSLHDIAERRIKLEAELELKGEQGLAQVLADAQRQVTHLQLEHDRLEGRAEAARVLHETFSSRRDQARDRYLSPFQQKIERYGRLVFGPSLEVTLDRELRVATRTLDGVTLEVDQLSVGAREQLAILSRLACAALVSSDGGAPVVLDDALGWTDPGRLDLMGAAIAVAARECQIIVLTCTPGRYQSVGNASVVHLTR